MDYGYDQGATTFQSASSENRSNYGSTVAGIIHGDEG
jgi:hypothetical protein